MMRSLILTAFLFATPTLAVAADVGQEAIDGCIDQLREVGGPDGQSGTVLSTEFSEANSLVMLQDRGETVWRCLVSSGGQVAELSVSQAAEEELVIRKTSPVTSFTHELRCQLAGRVEPSG